MVHSLLWNIVTRYDDAGSMVTMVYSDVSSCYWLIWLIFKIHMFFRPSMTDTGMWMWDKTTAFQPLPPFQQSGGNVLFVCRKIYNCSCYCWYGVVEKLLLWCLSITNYSLSTGILEWESSLSVSNHPLIWESWAVSPQKFVSDTTLWVVLPNYVWSIWAKSLPRPIHLRI